MIKQFGSKDSFAISVELENEFEGEWLFGRFCYWINGEEVGDFSMVTSLRDIYFQMKWIVHDCGKRDAGPLCDAEPFSVFHLLDRELYGSTEAITDAFLRIPPAPAVFDIAVPVPVFYDWKIYLLDCREHSLILYRHSNEGNVREAKIPPNLFDDCITRTHSYLENLYRSVSSDS